RLVCRQDFQGRKTRRSADRAADQIQPGDQPQDRRRTRRDDPGAALHLCRRGNRVKRRDRCRRIEFMVGIGGIADMNGWVAWANSVEFDPTETLAAKFAAMRNAAFPGTVW